MPIAPATPAPTSFVAGSFGLVPAALATVVGPPQDTSPWGAVAKRLQAATLGEFEILTELGRGGMAAVYLARDLALNRRVAIKIMAPGLLLGPGMIERFRQEAVTVANLQHAHIVSIHAVRQIEDLHFFVMQFVPGRTLEGVLREGTPLSIPVVRAWLYQIGAALGYAHRRGVIHRDIKPGNILLNADGEAIVTDFGIAKVAETPSHTQTGTVVGTPVYMSPEQCFAKELTGASDQYSLGVVAYEMLAGRPPFTGSSFSLMRAHTDEPPPPVREARPDVPPTMEAALLRMLAKRPEERFPTLAEALFSLGAAPIGPDDPLHATLLGLAAASERLELLGDILRTPSSPVPKTRERPPAAIVTPPAPVPATPTPVVVMAPVPVTPPPVVVIAAPPADLEPGATAALRATMTNAGGHAVPGSTLAWMSSAPGIVSVDAKTGELKAIATGSAIITASAGTAHDSVHVTIGEPKAATISISVPSAVVHAGERLPVSAVVTSRYGVRVSRPVEWSVDEPTVAAIDQAANWQGNASAVVRALTPGTAALIVRCDGAVGRASLRVSAAPAAPVPAPIPAPQGPREAVPQAPREAVLQAPREPAPHAAREAAPHAAREAAPQARQAAPQTAAPVPPAPAPHDERSRPVPPSTAPAAATPPARGVWRWAVPAVAAVGVVAYLALRPSAGDRQQTDPVASGPADSAIVTSADTSSVAPQPPTQRPESTRVANQPSDTPTAAPRDPAPSTPPRGAPVASRIELRPPRLAAIAPGESVAVSAIVRDASGAAISGARLIWASSDPLVATVDARGAVRGVTAGATRLTARSGDIVATLMVSVVPPPPDPAVVVSVEISDVRTLTVGESARLTASARNAAGSAASGAEIEWSSSNPGVASISQDGTLTARAAGSATIRATSGGRSADRPVTIRAREVATRPDTPSAPPSAPAAPPTKTEAELRTEILSVIATYARAIQTRDTSLIRRVFPTAGSELMTRWQTTFDDARGNIAMNGATVDVLDTPRDVAGAQVQVRARYSARFASRAARSDQSFPVSFTAVLQRDGGTWRMTSIR